MKKGKSKNFISVLIIFCFIHYSSSEGTQEANEVTDNKNHDATSDGSKNENEKKENLAQTTTTTKALYVQQYSSFPSAMIKTPSLLHAPFTSLSMSFASKTTQSSLRSSTTNMAQSPMTSSGPTTILKVAPSKLSHSRIFETNKQNTLKSSYLISISTSLSLHTTQEPQKLATQDSTTSIGTGSVVETSKPMASPPLSISTAPSLINNGPLQKTSGFQKIFEVHSTKSHSILALSNSKIKSQTVQGLASSSPSNSISQSSHTVSSKLLSSAGSGNLKFSSSTFQNEKMLNSGETAVMPSSIAQAIQRELKPTVSFMLNGTSRLLETPVRSTGNYLTSVVNFLATQSTSLWKKSPMKTNNDQSYEISNSSGALVKGNSTSLFNSADIENSSIFTHKTQFVLSHTHGISKEVSTSSVRYIPKRNTSSGSLSIPSAYPFPPDEIMVTSQSYTFIETTTELQETLSTEALLSSSTASVSFAFSKTKFPETTQTYDVVSQSHTRLYSTSSLHNSTILTDDHISATLSIKDVFNTNSGDQTPTTVAVDDHSSFTPIASYTSFDLSRSNPTSSHFPSTEQESSRTTSSELGEYSGKSKINSTSIPRSHFISRSVIFSTHSVPTSLPIQLTTFSVKQFSSILSNNPTSASFYSPSKTPYLNVTMTSSFVPTSYVRTEKLLTGSLTKEINISSTVRSSVVSLMPSTGLKISSTRILNKTTSFIASVLPSPVASKLYSNVIETIAGDSSNIESMPSSIKATYSKAVVARTIGVTTAGTFMAASTITTKLPTAATTRRSSSTHMTERSSIAVMQTTRQSGTATLRSTTATTTTRKPSTWKPTTEQKPSSKAETTSSPVVIGVPSVQSNMLFALPTALTIEFRVSFVGIQEAYKVQFIAQRHGNMVHGGKTLRTWYDVHYFQDYKYEPYIAGEFVTEKLVQRTKFNFTFGEVSRCKKEQVRFEHCNGPLESGAYRFQLRYHVHGSVRKSTFSKVYTTATVKTTTPDVPSTGINQSSITIAVIAVLAVLLVVIIIIAIVLYRRKNSQNNAYGDTEVSDCTLLTSLKRTSSCSKSCYGRGGLGGADSSIMLKHLTKGMSRPVHMKDFVAWVTRSQADSDFRFAEEFESIRDVGREQSHEASDVPENRGKNRYVNVLAYDKTRVKLSYTDDEIGSDYINANYLHGYKHPRSYIATQGPLPGTTDDFWRMIWEQNTFIIVMATQCMERNRVKCHEYWPGTQPTAYGDIVVSLLSEFAYPEWIEREFLLEVEDEGTRRIRHFQYTAWPDHGVPKHAKTVLEFVHSVRSNVLPGQGPLIVHCSAGVGRTGTLIAIDIILDRLQDEDTIDVYLTLCMMRMQRCNMVQTEDQYIFIHRVIVEYLKSRDSVSPFKGYYLLPKADSEDDQLEPSSDSPTANRDSGLALLLGEYDPERAEEALESVA